MAASFPHLDLDHATRDLMASIAECRDAACPVPQKHPFYPVPEQPAPYYGKRPCRPVVPTCLAKGKVMIIGEYPNCRFATVKAADGQHEHFVPVGDINEPFEGGRYFDGFSVRDYPTNTCLHRYYLDPLDLDLRSEVWLTNVNKCYLMKEDHIDAYAAIGWDTPAVQASFLDDDNYFAVAAVCIHRHLARELATCQPQLIIALGEKAYRMIHSSDDLQNPAADITMSHIAGEILRADQQIHALDQRNSLFRNRHVVHLYHPSYFTRHAQPDIVDKHLNEHIPAVRAFMQDLNLK